MAELQRTPAAGAAPPRKVYILEEPPSLPRGSAPSSWRADPEREIREIREIRGIQGIQGIGGSDPKPGARRWVLVLLVLLVLSWALWGALHGVSARNQQDLREELQRLQENSAGQWSEVWQTLEHVRWQQTELNRITALLCESTEDSRKCPPGWQFYQSSCYYFSALPRGWAGARSFCRDFGADLVVVSTEEEQLFLVRTIEANHTYWLGVRATEQRGHWSWVTGHSPSFGFWDVWEEDPDRAHKRCGAMRSNGRWFLERCSQGNRWVCEKSWACPASSSSSSSSSSSGELPDDE